jgi:oligosaccharyltransferase complex subunit alpha (ribophorin I)
MKKSKTGVGSPNAVVSLIATLPPNVSDVYYKDLVGNVTTSHFRSERNKSVLQLKPRYPLFGGWKFTWFHGYTTPYSSFLTSLGNDDYELTMSMNPTVPRLTCEHATLRIILPEGARYGNINQKYSDRKSLWLKSISFYNLHLL